LHIAAFGDIRPKTNRTAPTNALPGPSSDSDARTSRGSHTTSRLWSASCTKFGPVR